jgi:hypothetical protein
MQKMFAKIYDFPNTVSIHSRQSLFISHPGDPLMSRTRFALISLLTLVFSFLSLPAAVVFAVGERIVGVVTDAQNLPVAGATVVVTDLATKKTFTGRTDEQGRYAVDVPAAGKYSLVISSAGFSDAAAETLDVADAAETKYDARLQVAPSNVGAVTVSPKSGKPNADAVYQRLRTLGDAPTFSGVAKVNNLVLRRDAMTLTLQSGALHFLAPVENRVTAAVFIGDARMELTPPNDTEKRSLSIFTGGPSLAEDVDGMILRFTDKTYDEIKGSPKATFTADAAAPGDVQDAYRKHVSSVRKDLRTNLELRTLADLYAPDRPGFFTAFLHGKKHPKLIYQMDPLGIPDVSPEQVALFSYDSGDGGVWTSFHLAEEYQKGTGHSGADRRLFDFTRHSIDITIKGTSIAAQDAVTLVPRTSDTRVVPFDLFRTLRVKHVRDAQGADLDFIQEDKAADAEFAVILPKAPETGKPLTLNVEYAGDGAIFDSGGDNYFLLPSARAAWYPNNGGTQFGDRAVFDVTFHYPKKLTLIGTGAMVGTENAEKDVKTAKWSSGTTELAVSGFNYGRFKRKAVTDETTKYDIEFYANEELPSELRQVQLAIEELERQGNRTGTTLGSISTGAMADTAIAQGQNSTRVYDAFFGKLPYTRIALSQQPAQNFGQAWPTLVFMPYTAFIDTTQRTQLFGLRGGTDSFWKYVAPHEVAHQWWGHIIGWSSYRDQWMSEGFAEFSTSLYVQYVLRDLKKFNEFWEDQRKLIIQPTPSTLNRKPFTVGPVTQGYRLNTAKTGNVARVMIYPKGAYILHMIRMLMFDQKTQDQAFQAMMKDLVKSHYNRDITTDDFKKAVERHMLPGMDIDKNRTMDWFFDQWVYGTEMPSYQFTYKIDNSGGKPTLIGKITQSGVSKNFAMPVPVYLDFGKGWVRLGAATLVGETSVDVNVPLPQAPKQAAICAMNDVLAEKIDNVKQ